MTAGQIQNLIDCVDPVTWRPRDTTDMKLPQQPDNVNCGVYVCMYVAYIMSGNHASIHEVNENNIPAFRMWMAQLLCEYEVPIFISKAPADSDDDIVEDGNGDMVLRSSLRLRPKP